MDWKLLTDDIQIVIRDGTSIAQIQNLKNGWDWVKEESPLPFPAKVLLGKKSVPLSWTLEKTEEEPAGGKGRLCLVFRASQLSLSLKTIWEAREGFSFPKICIGSLSSPVRPGSLPRSRA